MTGLLPRWFYIVAPVVLIGSGVIASVGPFAKGADKFDAEEHCVEAIEARLKAPTTLAMVDTKVTGGEPWKVEGEYDAENTFGTPIRNSFTCWVTQAGDTQKAASVDLVQH